MPGRAIALTFVCLVAACAAACSGAPASGGQVAVQVAGQTVPFTAATCTWHEGDGQLVIEAGDAGSDYIRLAAPIDWMAAPLPEGPGADPELEVVISGNRLAPDPTSLDGAMNESQTEGTFLGTLADGRAISGQWSCPEVLEG
jgi:hypothetical protein